MSAAQPSAPKLATAAVIRALDGLDPPSKLTVLALAERVVRRHQSVSYYSAPVPNPQVGQTWVPRQHCKPCRTITHQDGSMVGYETVSTKRQVTLGEFSRWARLHNARALG